MLSADEITKHFSQADGTFRLARWDRAIAPVVFGVEKETLSVVKGAIEAVAKLANHPIVETDAELGSNLMFFFFKEWDELAHVPDLDRLVPGLSEVALKLEKQDANQYRHFRFENSGAIRAAYVFLRMDQALSDMAAEDLAQAQAVQVIVLWGSGAFAKTSPLVRVGDLGATILRPEIAALIAALYDPAMPNASSEPAQALRLSARLGLAHDA